MPQLKFTVYRLASAFALCTPLVATPRPASSQGAWQQYASPADAGFVISELDDARRYADSVRSAAVMVVYRGKVVAAWGDVSRELGLHSIRKSLVSALYGIGVAEKKIDLDATLAQLGIDDRDVLTPTEKSATIRDLISARSGIYLPAAYAGAGQDTERPQRGSHAAGKHWFYNNWDFNVAGVVYEQLTREKLYESFLRRIANPIGMEDYTISDGLAVLEPSRSLHPAHTFRMSTRDLARFGQLYLQNGKWNGKQIIPETWIKESTTAISETGPAEGYGYMWWTYAAHSAPPRWPTMRRHDLYQARGTGGQVMFVMPAEEMVIVMRGDTDNNRNVGGAASWNIAERVLAAKKTTAAAAPKLVALTPTPFQSQAPALAEQRFVSLTRAQLEKFVGSYTMGPDAIARVTLHDGRLFMYFPGQGEAELFALSPNEFTIRVITGVKVSFEIDSQGSATGVTATLGNQVMKGAKSN